MNCAIYTRFSTEKQSPASTGDQIRKCREYATKNGWQVLDAISTQMKLSAAPAMIEPA